MRADGKKRARNLVVFMVSRLPEDPGDFDFQRALGDDILKQVSLQISPHQFETWFRNLPIHVVDPARVVINASNRFSRNWLDSKFREIIARAARNVLGGNPNVEILVAPSGPPDYVDDPQHPPPERLAVPRADRHPREDSRRLPSRNVLVSTPIKRDHTFSNFVIGPSNRLAHAACLGVSEAPGRTYNPLFIYGEVGLGKTHLLHATVHRLTETPGLRVTYLTSEAFTNYFIGAIQEGNVDGFRRSLRSTDVLIVDDVQFISTKERTQEEFFHTFNALIAEAKQVVISSDCPPKEIPGLKERLVSRFKMGLVTRIEPPRFETRVAIVLKKAHARGADIPQPIAEYISNHVLSNIRELEGAITRLLSLAALQEGSSSLNRSPITMEIAKAALKEIVREENISGIIGIADIQKAVSLYYDVKLSELLSKSRARRVSFARQVCMYLVRHLTPSSLHEIGALVGNRDHSTVSYSVDRISELAEQDPRLKADLELISSRIQATRNVL
jgi:chromosomal replication initiator protein